MATQLGARANRVVEESAGQLHPLGRSGQFREQLAATRRAANLGYLFGIQGDGQCLGESGFRAGAVGCRAVFVGSGTGIPCSLGDNYRSGRVEHTARGEFESDGRSSEQLGIQRQPRRIDPLVQGV